MSATQRIIALHRAQPALNRKEIAEQVGCTVHLVRTVSNAHKLGIPHAPRGGARPNTGRRHHWRNWL